MIIERCERVKVDLWSQHTHSICSMSTEITLQIIFHNSIEAYMKTILSCNYFIERLPKTS